MRRYPSLLLLLLLSMAGCAVERGEVYVKEGKQYGVTSSQIWRGRWWNHYERGISYADGEFWDDAIADFQAALAQRQEDQRRARTYGLHFLDYFPHRELGIVYYRFARYPEAIYELEISLRREETAKAKFYLNRARKSLLEQTSRDTTPPRIVLDRPPDGLVTNRFSVEVVGHVEDEAYVSGIAVDGQALFVELAEPRIPFTREVDLHDGLNTIDIVAVDLLGHQAQQRLTVHVDRQGPLVSVERVELLGAPYQQQARVQGFLADRSRIQRFVLAGNPVPLQPGPEWPFRQEAPVTPGTASLPFEVEDAAGNVTRGEIALTPPASGPPGTRQGTPAMPTFPRWALLYPGTVLADLGALHSVPIQMAQRSDREPPVIKLARLEDRETVYDDAIYLEGEVTDLRAITAFAINGESLWRRKTQQLFFGQKLPLREGDNAFRLEAANEAGTTARRDLVVSRAVQKARQPGSRLRVIHMPFEKKGTPSVLAETVYDSLFDAFVSQKRFDFVDRHQLEAILRELKLSQTDLVDPATAAKIGKIAAAEGILIGTVVETQPALEVYARFVDVETSVVLAAADIYGEELTLRTMKTLMEGLALKLRRHFPLVEGSIIERKGRELFVDLTSSQGVMRYMKLIIFREGQESKHPTTGRMLKKPDTPLGDARITAVSTDLSKATLLHPEQSEDVQELDKVITK
jgi:Curli production assembly/transport component CsgG/Glucodextranase, domain B